jgi:hypothetical protein
MLEFPATINPAIAEENVLTHDKTAQFSAWFSVVKSEPDTDVRKDEVRT